MTYIEKTLVSNEKIEHIFKLSFVNYISILVYMLIFYAISFITIKYGLSYIYEKNFDLEAYLSIFIIFLMGTPWIIPIKKIEQGVTNRRVIYKSGVFSRITNEIRLEAIQTIEIEQSFWGRIFNYGNVSIIGRGNGEIAFKNVSDPLMVKKSIEEAAEKREVFLSNRGEVEI